MSDGKILAGSSFLPDKNVSLPFTEQVRDYDKSASPRVTGAEAEPAVDQSPMDSAAAKVRIYNRSAIQTAFEAIKFKYATRISNVDLPRELLGLTVVKNSANGIGVGSHPVTKQGFTVRDSASGTINPRSSNEASAAVSFEISPIWRPVLRKNGPAMAYGFHTVSGATEADICTALANGALAGQTVYPWPNFIEVSHSLIVSGQQVSVKVVADSSATAAFDGDGLAKMSAYEWGDDYSQHVAIDSKVIELPECINETITLVVTEATELASATAQANTKSIVSNLGVVIVSPITNQPPPRTKEAKAQIQPTTLQPTPIGTIPSSGLYLYKYDFRDVGWGMYEVLAIVIDMSYYV